MIAAAVILYLRAALGTRVAEPSGKHRYWCLPSRWYRSHCSARFAGHCRRVTNYRFSCGRGARRRRGSEGASGEGVSQQHAADAGLHSGVAPPWPESRSRCLGASTWRGFVAKDIAGCVFRRRTATPSPQCQGGQPVVASHALSACKPHPGSQEFKGGAPPADRYASQLATSESLGRAC